MNAKFYASVLLLLVLGLPTVLIAQSMIGLQSSAYSGIYGAAIQPAGLAGSPLKVDVNLFSFSVDYQNDFVSFDTRAILDEDFITKDNYRQWVTPNYDGRKKNGVGTVDMYLPSFMLTLPNRMALGFSWRARAIQSFYNLDESIARSIYEQGGNVEDWLQPFDNSTGSANLVAYNEFGVSFAMEVLRVGSHVLKAGITGKYLGGSAQATIYTEDFRFAIIDSNAYAVDSAVIRFPYSQSMEDLSNGGGGNISDLMGFNPNSYGWGVDLGLVYEIQQEKNTNGRTTSHVFRLGVSLLDAGSISFERASESQDYRGSAIIQTGEGDPADIGRIDSILDANFTAFDGGDYFTIRTPMSLSVQADLRLGRGFYFNLITQTPLVSTRQAGDFANFGRYSLTAGWENRWWGVAMPLTWISNNDFNAGMFMRMGPFLLGSDNFWNLVTGGQVRGASFQFAFRIPIPDNTGKTKHQAPESDGPDMDKGSLQRP